MSPSLRVPLIGVGIALLLAVAFWFLLLTPKMDEQRLLEDERASIQDQQMTVQADIARLLTVRDNEPAIRAELARMEQLVPAEIAQPTALAEFQQAADAAGLDVTALSFADPVMVEPEVALADGRVLSSIDATMTIEGSYFEAVDLLRRLEEGERGVLVDTLTMAEGEEGYPELVTNWTGRLFAALPRPAGAEQPAATDPAAGGGTGSEVAPPSPADSNSVSIGP